MISENVITLNSLSLKLKVRFIFKLQIFPKSSPMFGSTKLLMNLKLTKCSSLMKKVSTRPLFQMSQRNSISFSSFKPFRNISGSNFRSFSTSKEFTCEKIADINAELIETFNNNTDEMLEALPGKGVNVSSFYLNRLSKMCYLQEPKLYEVLYQNLEENIDSVADQNTILSIAEGLHTIRSNENVFPKIPETLITKLVKRFNRLRPLFTDKNLEKVQNLLSIFSTESNSELHQTTNTESSGDFNLNEFLEAIESSALYNEIKDVLNIVEVNRDKNFIRVRYIPTEQVIDIFGCEAYPNSNLDEIVSHIKQNPQKINLFMVEDSPLFLPSDPSNEVQANFAKSAEETRRGTKLMHQLEKGDIDMYIRTFIDDQELFEFDQEKEIVYTKVNPMTKVPSEIGTTSYHFHDNADLDKNPKLILIDLTLQEIIGKMSTLFNKDQLVNLVDLLNYCTLTEKAYYADYCQLNGCPVCKDPSNYQTQLPKDMVSIVAGDKEMPLDYRSQFLSRMIFENFKANPSSKHALVVIGSFHIYQTLKELMVVIKHEKDGKLESFDRFSHLRSLILDFRDIGKNTEEQLEKLAILETIYQAIDMSILENFNPQKTSVNFNEYIKLIQKYSQEMSYEKLARYNDEVKIRPGECGGENIIFGLGYDEKDDLDQKIDFPTGKGLKEKLENQKTPEKAEPQEPKIKLKSNLINDKKGKKN